MVSYNISLVTECTISNLKLSKDEKFVIPKQPGNITKLIIKDSTIPRLTEDLLGAFADLEEFVADSIGIEEVSEESFVGCKNLKEIYLRENQIKALEPNIFNRNTKLETLWLNDNQLDFLPKELFLNLENLNVLNISRNNLTSLSKKIFTNLKNLELFYVSGNQLTDIKIEEILKQCSKLRGFGIYDNDFSRAVLENIQKHLKDAGVMYNFSYNLTLKSRSYATQKLDGVQYIPDEEYERLLAIKKNSELKKIPNTIQKNEDLPSYKISCDGEECTITDLQLSKDEKFVFPKQPENITQLKIENSTIPRLTRDLLQAFPNLEEIRATFVGIQEVSEDAFVDCEKLESIVLAKNQIKALEPNTFNRNTNLDKIWLSDNQLDFLPNEIFLNLKNLRIVSLRRNNLTSLPAELFTNLEQLKEILVSGNQLMDLQVEEILTQCPDLTWLGIYDNNFSHSALKKILESLKDAEVAYNYDYDCPLRSRSYATRSLDEVEYIPDEEYERLLQGKKEQQKEIPKSTEVDEELLKKITNLIEKKFELMQQGVEKMRNTLQ